MTLSLSQPAPAEQDDVLIVDSDEEPSSSATDVAAEPGGHKRKLQDAETGEGRSKRKRLAEPATSADDDIIALD